MKHSQNISEYQSFQEDFLSSHSSIYAKRIYRLTGITGAFAYLGIHPKLKETYIKAAKRIVLQLKSVADTKQFAGEMVNEYVEAYLQGRTYLEEYEAFDAFFTYVEKVANKYNECFFEILPNFFPKNKSGGSKSHLLDPYYLHTIKERVDKYHVDFSEHLIEGI